MVQLMKHN